MTKREYVVAEGRKNGGRGDWGKLQGREELSIMVWKVFTVLVSQGVSWPL